MYRQLPYGAGNLAVFGGNRNLVPLNRGIATTSVRTGLAMTGNLKAKRQTPIYRASWGLTDGVSIAFFRREVKRRAVNEL